MADDPPYHTQRWTKHFECIDSERVAGDPNVGRSSPLRMRCAHQ